MTQYFILILLAVGSARSSHSCNDNHSHSPLALHCFTCHYRRSRDEGMKNCDDPFHAKGIPLIPCDGSCAITNITTSPQDYMIVRSCLLNCKDIDDAAASVKCCSWNQCNGAGRRQGPTTSMLTVLGTCSVLVLIVICCGALCTKK